MSISHEKKNARAGELPVILIGGGGHAKILVEILRLTNRKILAIADPNPGQWICDIQGVKILSDDAEVLKLGPSVCQLVNAVGSTKSMTLRRDIYEKFKAKEFAFCTIIHPSAIIAEDVQIGSGSQIMAGVIIQTGSRIGENCIINTGTIIDHDGNIGSHVHIATGTTLSGTVTIGTGTHVGTAAVVIQSITIGQKCLVAAGAVVTTDVEDGRQVAGVPARSFDLGSTCYRLKITNLPQDLINRRLVGHQLHLLLA